MTNEIKDWCEISNKVFKKWICEKQMDVENNEKSKEKSLP